jgi:hypothetical protein
MNPSEEFDLERDLPPESEDLVEDLGLGTLFGAMAQGDKFILTVARAAVLSCLSEPEEILYRQEVLADLTAHPQLAMEIYSLATEALEAHRKVTFWTLNITPESLRYYSVQSLELLLGYLVRLRRLAEENRSAMVSPGLARLGSLLLTELDDEYIKRLESHLNELKLPGGLMMSAQLGQANRGTAYTLHRSRPRGLRERFANRGQASSSFTVPERDDNVRQALTELHARGVNIAANTLAQSTDHVLGFLNALRVEIAFYVGCINLRAALGAKGEPTCAPVPLSAERPGFAAEGLYDPCLSLNLSNATNGTGRAVGNDVSASTKVLILVTGANRGGKSTFLRSVGLAQLMMQCGMFVAAASFSAGVCPRVFTHFKRDEDPAMKGGKLDEELARMSAIVSHICPGALLLCNEPFASTNEAEGSEIGRQVFIALSRAGVKIVVVTHLFDLAESLYEKGVEGTLFMRAPRQAGAAAFKLMEGPPEPTAYGEDVYRRVFGESATAIAPASPPLGSSRHGESFG